jgi:hypothetical protein
VWFADPVEAEVELEHRVPNIGEITPGGAITEYALPAGTLVLR